MLDEMFWWNASKYAIFLEYENPTSGGKYYHAEKMFKDIEAQNLGHQIYYYSNSLRAKSYPQLFLRYHQAPTSVGVCTPTPTLV